MRGTGYLLGAVVAFSGVVVYMAYATGDADREAAPVFGVKIRPGYRDWRLSPCLHLLLTVISEIEIQNVGTNSMRSE